jgi:anti-sigma factor RsiW
MTCDSLLVSSYRDGELSPDVRRQVDEHLNVCDGCAALLRGYIRTAQAIRSMPYQPVPPSVAIELRQRIAERETTGLGLGVFRGLGRAVTPALATAAVALTFLVVFRPGAVEAPTKTPVVVAPAHAPTAQDPVVVTTPSIVPVSRDDAAPRTARVASSELLAAIPPSIGRLYRSSQALQVQLGTPAPGSKTVTLMEQSFQGGVALWRGDTREIYVLNRDGGTWAAYPDTWRPGDPVAVEATPPPGAMAPAGGFGALWKNSPEVKSRLGWAVFEPRGSGGAIQSFEHGLIVWSPHGLLYVLADDGTWRTYPDAAPL